MNIIDLREKIVGDIFSSMELKNCLTEYKFPQDKIAVFIKRGEIIPICRGLYTFTATLRREPLSSGVLANRIHGPSYVSEDFALSYYGLIPETPQVVTSISMGRAREFDTPFGRFTYRFRRSLSYSIGISIVGEGFKRFLIATPEKALFDKIWADQRFDGSDVETYLFEDLRLDESCLKSFNRKIIQALAPFMRGRLQNLREYLRSL